MKTLSPFAHETILEALTTLPTWQYDAATQHITARYRFKDYIGACGFVMRVSLLAEKHNHHPDIRFGWGYAEISLTTHDAKGITERDITLAVAIDNAMRDFLSK